VCTRLFLFTKFAQFNELERPLPMSEKLRAPASADAQGSRGTDRLGSRITPQSTSPPSINQRPQNKADTSVLKRIFARCVVRGECWEWTGPRRRRGYGAARVPGAGRRKESTHRLVMRCLGFDIEGKYVCHRCDNPPCINPDHLFVGTAKENVHDAMAKGRFVRRGLNDKCVSFHSKRGTFQASLQRNKRRVWLGYFKTEAEALAAVAAARGQE
jgi:hypothetical protein